MKSLNPENLKSKSLRVASVFIHPLVTSISYFLDVLFECGRTRGLEGTCFPMYFHVSRESELKRIRFSSDIALRGERWRAQAVLLESECCEECLGYWKL